MPVRLPAIVAALLLPLACDSLCDSGRYLIRYVSVKNGTNSPECLNSTQPSRFPCRSLTYALLAADYGRQYPNSCNYSSGPDNLCVRLEDGVHQITGELQVTNASNLVVEAVNAGGAHIRCGSFPGLEPYVYDDLVFFCSRNVTLSGVVVEQCGPVSSGLYVLASDGVTIQDCVFRNTTATAIEAYKSHNLVVHNCLFEANINDATTNAYRFNKSSIDLDDLNILSSRAGAISVYSNATVGLEIENCVFKNNIANDGAVVDKRPPLVQLDGHGGAVFIRLSGANKSRVLFRNSTFESNTARIQGGAIYVSMSGQAANSNFVVEGCTFTNNSAQTRAGGALTIVLFSATLNNKFVIRGSTFRGNSAVGGGAVAVIRYDLHAIGYPDVVAFENCLFELNTAEREGSAVGLFSLLHNNVKPFPVSFSNCSFWANHLRRFRISILAEVNEFQRDPGGALSSFRYPIKLSGHNNFLNNTGGGLSVINTEIDVEQNAQVLFQENAAIFGGGIQMEDNCRLFVSPGAKMNFTNNHAHLGGAIYMFLFQGECTNYIRNRRCLIQYNDPELEDVPAENWQNVSIAFTDNTAEIGGAALYISDIRGCFWLNSFLDADEHYTIFTPPPSASSPFTFSTWYVLAGSQCVNVHPYPVVLFVVGDAAANTLLFSGNQLLNDSKARLQVVSSETFASDSLSIEIDFASGQDTFAQSGEDVLFSVVCKDFFNNSRTCLLNIKEVIANESNAAHFAGMQQSTLVVLDDVVQNLSFRVPSLATGNGSLSTTAASQSHFQLELGLPLTDLKTEYFARLDVTSCHPGYKRGSGGLCECDTDNTDILRCDTNGRYLFVREGVYAYVSNKSRELTVINGAPPGYISCDRVGRLPGCRFKFDDANAQCSLGRTGFLCGSCPRGTWVSLDLLFCSESCEVGIGLLFLWCAVVIGVSLFVLIFDIGHHSELRAFVFYAEVIGFVFIPFAIIDNNLSLAGLGYFLNLLSFSIPISWCVSKTLPAHIVALFSYIPPLLILGTVIVYIICARYISAISSRSALHGLSLLSLFMYMYTASTSFRIASCRLTETGFVYLYDGNQSCLAANFVPFLVLSLLIIFCYVLMAPFLLCLLTKKRWTVFDLYHFTDEVSKDLKQSQHWYAGWDLGRRLLFLLSSYFGIYLDTTLLAMINFFVAFVVLLVQVFAKPYKSTHNNIIETAILVNLLLVAASYLQSPETTAATVLVVILTLLPYFYAVVYVAIATGRKIHRKYQEHKKKDSPSDAAAANKEENRDAIQMDTLANTAALQQDTEGPMSTATATGASTTTDASATTAPPPQPPPAATEKSSAVVDPFNFSENQIDSSRGMFSASMSFSSESKK